MELKIYKDLDDTQWQLLLDPTNEIDRTIYTQGGTCINVYSSVTEVDDWDTINGDDIITIGGFLGSVNVIANTYVYVRTTQIPGRCYHLPKGQLDPDIDPSVLSDNIDELRNNIEEHKEDRNDPHDVTREQVDLSTIPNSVRSTLPDPDALNGSLINDHCAYAIVQLLTAFTNRTDNPHNVTKAQLELDNVVNMAPAVEPSDVFNSNNNTMLSTIKSVFDIVKDQRQVESPVPGGYIVGGPVVTLSDEDQLKYDPDANHFVIEGNNLALKAGLKVTYTYDNLVMTSRELAGDIYYAKTAISTDVNPKPGWHYVYVNITVDGTIYHISSTQIRPTVGIRAVTTSSGDHIDINTGQIFNNSGIEIRRAYVAKVYVNESGTIERIVNVPQGHVFVKKIVNQIIPETTYTFDNPFYGPITVVPEIYIGDQWADPYWAEQAGVRATWTPDQPNNIIVQTGALGLATIAVNSGNAFTSTNLSSTYGGSAPLRLVIRR